MQTTFTFQITNTTTPAQLLTQILNKRANTLMSRGERVTDFVLKVCGQEEYLIGEYPIVQYSYIQDCLAKDVIPSLVTTSIKNINVYDDSSLENHELDNQKRSRPSFSTLTLRKKGKHISAWKIDDQFVFSVNAISRLNCDSAHRTVDVINEKIILLYLKKD